MKKRSISGESREEAVRINKLLSDAGVCSRREADRLIEQGKVLIDGKKAEKGQRVTEGQEVICDGEPVRQNEEMVLIAFNKPVGIVCTTDSAREKDNIIDYINYPRRIYPVGRLDKMSEGLILLTNDGSIVNRINKASFYHEKEYEVKVNRPVDEAFIKGMSSGVEIDGVLTRKCKVKKTGSDSFNIILTQGLNRQIRKMCESFGYRVISLKRVRVMNIRLGRLRSGAWRNVTASELEKLKSLI